MYAIQTCIFPTAPAQITHATSRHSHEKTPYFSFLHSKGLYDKELSQYWTGNNPKRHWPSTSSLRSFPISNTTWLRSQLSYQGRPLTEQRLVVPIGCHISTQHAQMGTRISGSIILDKFRWLKLGRHDNLGEICQTIKINASPRAWTLNNVHLFRKFFHLVLNLTLARLWGLILRRIHFLFTSLWANGQWGPIIVWIQRRCLIFKLGPESCCNGVGPNELCPPPTTYRCIMCIISASCSFRRLMSLALSSTRQGPLVDISLARDLVMMRSRCDGNFNCFLWAIFSVYNPRKNKRMRRERYEGVHLKIW